MAEMLDIEELKLTSLSNFSTHYKRRNDNTKSHDDIINNYGSPNFDCCPEHYQCCPNHDCSPYNDNDNCTNHMDCCTDFYNCTNHIDCPAYLYNSTNHCSPDFYN